MRNQKGITLVALVVTIIVLIILTGISINLILGDNGIITIAKKARENTELAKIQEETELNEFYEQINNELSSIPGSSYEAIAKLAEFKNAIANYIEEAGGIKPEEDAEITTFGDRIKGIVNEVTKNATATADNISEGKTAWVNGKLITGTGADNKSYYLETIGKITKIKLTTTDIKTITSHYQELTIDNFACVISGVSGSTGPYSTDLNGYGSKSFQDTLKYNNSTGIISAINGTLGVNIGATTSVPQAYASYNVYMYIPTAWLN